MRFRWFSAERAGGGWLTFVAGRNRLVRKGGPGGGRIRALAALAAMTIPLAGLGQAQAQFLAFPDASATSQAQSPPAKNTKATQTQVAQARAVQPQGLPAAGNEPEANGPHERLNRNTTTIMADDPDGTLMRLAYDMARVLDAGSDLRVLPIVGKGARQNVSDLLHLKGIDIGLTQSDVLADLKRTGQLGEGLEDRLAYIAKICNLEVHVVARSDIATVGDLAGKPVNFGPPGSGAQFTAHAVFKLLGIEPVEVNETVEEARLDLANGKIAAYVVVDGKPSRRVAPIGPTGTKLLALPYPAALEQDYLPAKLSHDDYPDLIPEGEAVDTVALGAVLAVYNWPAKHERHQRVGRLVNLFFSASDEFQKAPRHPKWREANLAAPFPGWVRFKPAQDWLDRRLAEAGGSVSAGNAANVDPKRARVLAEQVAPGNPVEQQRLFELFVGKTALPQ